MKNQPTLQTDRLILRPFTLVDAEDVHRYVSDKAIAATTLRIPHPYEKGMAEAWINSRHESFQNNTEISFAIERKSDQQFLGTFSLLLELEHQRAAFGYYIGKPFWNNGYATEAACRGLQYGFEELNLNRIYAVHFKHNPASGRVMQKLGMKHEASLRQSILKWSEFVDEEVYGILKNEF